MHHNFFQFLSSKVVAGENISLSSSELIVGRRVLYSLENKDRNPACASADTLSTSVVGECVRESLDKTQSYRKRPFFPSTPRNLSVSSRSPSLENHRDGQDVVGCGGGESMNVAMLPRSRVHEVREWMQERIE